MFTDLAGNLQVKHLLKRLIASNRVPNSLLFAGDDGIGKRQFAFELARALMCPDPRDGEGCGVCATCRRIGRFDIPTSTDKNKDDFKKVFFGGHIDIGLVVAYKRLILVDAIRDLERHANYRPFEARARVFIIDEAERMNDEASNALLKTLEEPPSTTHIFLISSKPESLLPTIRSRAQVLRFAPVSVDEIERYLIDQQAVPHHDAHIAARLARGSIGRAVSINLGEYADRRASMVAVLKAVIDTGDVSTLLRISEQMNDAKNKEAFEENIAILESLIHDVWSLAASGDPMRIANADLADQLGRLAVAARPSDLVEWLAAIQTMRENLVVNINRRIATDALFSAMASA
jgi:DNA polymerase III subunit delta'